MRFAVTVKIIHVAYEIVDVEDEVELEDVVKEMKSSAIDHASEDVVIDTECLDCEEEES